MHRGFGREGDTGVHTVEGTKAGSRAAGLTQLRAADQEAYEAKKRKLEEDEKNRLRIESKQRSDQQEQQPSPSPDAAAEDEEGPAEQ